MKLTVGNIETQVSIEIQQCTYWIDVFVAVGCKKWRPSQDEAMLEAHASTDHSDVCLSYLFTSHVFKGVLGNISLPRPD